MHKWNRQQVSKQTESQIENKPLKKKIIKINWYKNKNEKRGFLVTRLRRDLCVLTEEIPISRETCQEYSKVLEEIMEGMRMSRWCLIENNAN